jgi:hypothetical protein
MGGYSNKLDPIRTRPIDHLYVKKEQAMLEQYITVFLHIYILFSMNLGEKRQMLSKTNVLFFTKKSGKKS